MLHCVKLVCSLKHITVFFGSFSSYTYRISSQSCWWIHGKQFLESHTTTSKRYRQNHSWRSKRILYQRKPCFFTRFARKDFAQSESAVTCIITRYFTLSDSTIKCLIYQNPSHTQDIYFVAAQITSGSRTQPFATKPIAVLWYFLVNFKYLQLNCNLSAIG